MKKDNKLKFLVLFISIFAYSSIVLAGIAENPEIDLVCEKIKEDENLEKWQTEWEANLPICEYGKIAGYNSYPQNGDKIDSYKDIIFIRDEQIKGTMETSDAKGYDEIEFTRCNKDDPNVKITASASCKYRTTSANKNISCSSTSGKKGCRPNGNTGPNGETLCDCDDESSEIEWKQDFTFTGDDQPDDNYFETKCKEETGYNCNNCEVNYTLTCPVYQCDPKEQQVQVCTPTFTTDDGKGDPAYCVNPNQGLAETYELDQRFDVSKCANSRATVDCGFANILIESAWQTKHNYPISNQETQLALRLWGVHSGQAGYDKLKVGVANVITKNGQICKEPVTFYKSTKYETINIYQITHDYIMEYLFDDINKQKGNYIDTSKSESYFDEIACDKVELGVVCGKGKYRDAFSLFFSSFFGNEKMEEHLSDLVGIDATPTDVEIVTEGETSKIEFHFPHRIESKEENIYKCSEIKEDTKLIEQGVKDKSKLHFPDLSDEDRKYIEQYCNLKVEKWYAVDDEGNQIPVYCKKDNPKLKECDGINNDDSYFDGSKGTIVYEIIPFAVCNKETTETYDTYHVIYRTPKIRTKNTVEKYVACNGAKNNQILYSFGGDTKTETTTDIETTEDSWNTRVDKKIKINCADGGCEEYNIRDSEDDGKCSATSTENGTYSDYVKDPSLSCIVNMKAEDKKNYYDYSNYYGVNTDLCRVYCSDEVEYYIADRINATSGETFTYNITPFEAFNTEEKKLSSQIKVKRTCVSQIAYDNNSFKDRNKLLNKYGITEEDLDGLKEYVKLEDINNWQSLFAVLASKNYKEGQRTENLNELIYDLYNCNFISNIPSNIVKPKDNTIGKVYDYIKKLYSKDNNYGFVTSPSSSLWNSNVTYDGGAEYIDNNSSVGAVDSDINMDKVINSNNNLEIKYCTGDVSDCLSYSAGKENYNLTEFKSNNNIGFTSVKGKDFSSNFKNIINTKIPKNDFAAFEITTNFGFYNNSKFETEAYSGKVRKISSDAKNDLIKLNDYIYPLSKNAYNNEECSKFDDVYNQCPVTQKYNNISTYYRNNKSDSFTQSLNKKFTCYVNVKKPKVTVDDNSSSSVNNTIYRNVDIKNLFPSGIPENSNWSTEIGLKAKEEIEESYDSINTAQDEYLEYSFTLTPEAVKSIRSYNENKAYTNNTQKGCKIEDGKFFNCKSDFLNNVRGGGSTNYGIIVNKGDGISNHTNNQ